MTDIGRFQCGIAAVIYHPPTKTYLLLQRAAKRDFGGREWESVTGRVNQQESYETALHREVREELGIAVQIEFIVGTSHFYRGEPTPENELLAVRYACLFNDPREAIQISDEHMDFRWLTADEIYSLLPSTHWLYQSIQRIELMRSAIAPELLAIFQTDGFETL